MAPAHSKRSPAFQLYPAEFLGSHQVSKMGMTERGAYITLLCRCWINNGLSSDLSVLADYCDMKPDRFERMWKRGRLGKCFIERGGKFHNERLDEERKKQADYKRRQSDRAKERWNKANEATASQSMPPHATASHGIAGFSLNSSDLVSSGSVSSRSGPIIRKRRLDAAYEHEDGLYVPDRLHRDFLALHGNLDERAMFAWYEHVCEGWRGRDDKGADMFRFWKLRHDERWPPDLVTTQPASRPKPAWARKSAVQS